MGVELSFTLFGVTVLGSVIVAAIVEKLKNLLKTTGWWNTALALVVGTALGAFVWLLERYVFQPIGLISTVMPILVCLGQGFFSGGVAAGLWKVVKTFSKGTTTINNSK